MTQLPLRSISEIGWWLLALLCIFVQHIKPPYLWNIRTVCLNFNCFWPVCALFQFRFFFFSLLLLPCSDELMALFTVLGNIAVMWHAINGSYIRLCSWRKAVNTVYDDVVKSGNAIPTFNVTQFIAWFHKNANRYNIHCSILCGNITAQQSLFMDVSLSFCLLVCRCVPTSVAKNVFVAFNEKPSNEFMSCHWRFTVHT